MNLHRLTFEHSLFILAFLVALGVRLLNLGLAPLSDSEAAWALQAWQIAGHAPTGAEQALGPQPAYVFLTGVSFFLLGSTNFLARFWPALAGAGLIFLPLLFRHWLGRAAALILAFGLALDPGLVAVSRQAGGPMLALASSLLAIGLWYTDRRILAGIFAGLALLSGPAVISGVLGLALAWIIAWRNGKPRYGPLEPSGAPTWQRNEPGMSSSPGLDQMARQPVLLIAGAVILVFGTLFMRFPQGLAAWFEALPAYLGGWVSASGIPALRLLAALFFFQPLALIFALFGAVRPWTQEAVPQYSGDPVFRTRRWTLFLLLWAVISLALAMIYPARQVVDLVWVLVPLWTLAAIELSSAIPEAEPSLVSLGQAVLLFLLMALMWFSLAALNRTVPGPEGSLMRLAVLLGIIALGALTTALVSLGWSWTVGRQGLVWGVSAGLTVYMLSALWGAAFLRPNQPQELWGATPATGQAGLFINTLESLSEWNTGFPRKIDLAVSVDTPSLRWALRHFPEARFVTQPAARELPSIVITRQEQPAPALSAAYRGQDFAWWISPGWTGALPPNLTGWLTFRQAPLQQEHILLWARSDLFPGGSLLPEEPTVEEP